MNKQKIIEIGCLLWDKDLASGLNGNISFRQDNASILLTGHGTCLGFLEEKDLVQCSLDGQVLGNGKISSENLLHRDIYKNFPEVSAVIHTHTPYTNGYFLGQSKFTPRIFEAKFVLGDVECVPQSTPSVTETAAVIAALMKNNIVVLGNHGVVAMGKDLFDCFVLIQALEEGIKTEAVARLFSSHEALPVQKTKEGVSVSKKYKLFSSEQIDEIVKIVNADNQMKELGEKTNMTMDLAVKMQETGQAYCFSFRKGNIDKIEASENAEFLITAPESVWRAVFNREIDPFVATTQKKMHLKGDFAKISKWYAPCSRVFELWRQVPVE